MVPPARRSFGRASSLEAARSVASGLHAGDPHSVAVPSAEVVGVYDVEADEPCSLVELVVHDVEGPFDVGAITQADRNRPRKDWQVPYAEKLLDVTGRHVVHDSWDGPLDSSMWHGEMWLAFFFHYLDEELLLSTPFGDLRLPHRESRPSRLRRLTYEAP